MQGPIIEQPQLVDPPTPPLVGAEIWQQVMARAGYRCQCKWCPGKCRKSADGCPVEARPGVRLVAGPYDPGPDPLRRIRAVPVEDLLAWCPKCWDRKAKDSRKTYRHLAERDLKDRTETLF